MSSSEVSLKWNGFESNMLNCLKYAYKDEDYSDVSLVCEGISIKSHKVVLSACSPLFKNIFAQNPHHFTVIVLQDVTLFNLRSLLTFIYNGEVNVNQENLSELLKAAENLKIRGLTTIPEDSNELNDICQSKKGSELKPKENVPVTSNLFTEPSFVGAIIPKEELPDTMCETIINEGYTSETGAPHHTEQSPYLPAETATKGLDNYRVKEVVSGKSEVKSGKIKKRKSKMKKRHNLCINVDKSSHSLIVGEVGKENLVTDEDIEKDMDNVLQSDIVLEAFNTTTATEENLKSEQTDVSLDYGGPKFPCPFCTRTYHTWGYRRRHVKSRHRINRLTCKICQEQNSSQSSWFDHVVHRHSVGRAEARDSLVILVEAHAVLTCTSPPSPTHLLEEFQKENEASVPL